MTFPAQSFTTGQVLTAAQMNEISTEINDLWRLTFRAVTGTSDTLALADSYNKIVTYSNTNTTTITIPNSSSVAFTTGSIINILKTGATGTVSIVQGSGVTISSAGITATNPTITLNSGFARIIKTGGDSFSVEGDITQAAPVAPGFYGTVLATGTLSGASLDLQSISGSYKDLILEVYNPYVASAGIMLLRFNNESGASTHGHVYMKTNDVGLTAANGTSISTGVFAAGSNNNTSYARFIIPDYAATTHRKTVYWNGTDTVDARSYWGTGWRNNSSDAINRVTLFVNGQNWSGGTYNLYGVN